MKKLSGLIAVFIFLPLHAVYLVDDAETANQSNSSGGTWSTYNDVNSVIFFIPDHTPGYEGNYSRSLSWNINQGAVNFYAGAVTGLNASWAGVDLSSYSGVRFYARGNGIYEITLATDQTRDENNHYSKYIYVTQEWTLFQLPFSQFTQKWGTTKPWEPSSIFSVGFSVITGAGNSGEIQIDRIEFYQISEAMPFPDPNIIIRTPKVNQEGYLVNDKKYFCISSVSASAGDTFSVLNSRGTKVFQGVISGSPVIDTASTGEFVWKSDFSEWNTPGEYTIHINGFQSHTFSISDSVYNDVFKDALRCFYLIRCGIAENDEVTGINRPACHTNLTNIRGTGSEIDVTGGWHNAQDLGVYVHETSISIAFMLWLYEIRPEVMKNIRIDIPESEIHISDLLNEAKWGLDWLLKMQKNDGSVYHKVDAEPELFDCIPPEEDNTTRFVEFQAANDPQIPSTIDAADFAAVMSQAYRVFKNIDQEFSLTCLNAAQKAWNWIETNPGKGQTDPFYTDAEYWQEYLWAMAEMARTLDDNALRSEFNSEIDSRELAPVGWGDPHLFGYIAQYYDPGTSSSIKDNIKSKVNEISNKLISVVNSTGYAVASEWYEYWWESNEQVLNKGNLLLFAYEITGIETYRNAALSQLHYILGLNSLDKSFVTGHGKNSVKHPWHWIYLAYGKEIPGWATGGPNSYPNNDWILTDLIHKGTPRAKCYADVAECDLGSWASNEGETSENAALVFFAGYFYHGEISLSGQEYPHTESKISVIPSPCNADQNCSEVIFSGLPPKSVLMIFDIQGKEIFYTREISEDGSTIWKINKSINRYSDTGIFIYSVTDKYGKVITGKFAVSGF